MISDEIVKKLVQEIFLHIKNSAVHQEVMEDPEKYLISLLESIKRDMPDMSSTLFWTVESASFHRLLEEAKRKLREVS